MPKKGQVIFIHGGDSFATQEAFYDYLRAQEYEPHPEPRQRWRDWLQAELEPAGYEWLFMGMPNKENADYEAWKIWFEKVIPYIESNTPTHVVGYSLGACFLLRYLTEHDAPFVINALHLVALCLPLDGEELGSFGVDIQSLPLLHTKVRTIELYHSTDDPICPYAHSEQVAAVVPGATLHTFTDRGHFFQPSFPELLAQIQK
jgi:predicted alpha/beta hydrolase family esterase